MPDCAVLRRATAASSGFSALQASLRFAVKAWQESPRRLVGFFPRTHVLNETSGGWQYISMMEAGEAGLGSYSTLLSKLLVLDTGYLFQYTCSMPPGIHAIVDQLTNCEDIAINFLVTNHSGLGPLLVEGQPRDHGDSHNSDQRLSKVGLRTNLDSDRVRTQCLNDMADLWPGGLQVKYSYGGLSAKVEDGSLCEIHGELHGCRHKLATKVDLMRHKVQEAEAVPLNQKSAYAFLLSKSEMFAATIVAVQTLKLTGTVHDVVLLISSTLPLEKPEKDIIKEHFTSSVRVTIKGRGKFGILNAWTLTEYQKVVYLDSGSLVLENIDQLFLRPQPAAAPALGRPMSFTAGLLVLQPSTATYNQLIYAVPRLAAQDIGEDAFLNLFFSAWSVLPPAHRIPVKFCAELVFPDMDFPSKGFRYLPSNYTIDKVHELILGPLAVVRWPEQAAKPWDVYLNAVQSGTGEHPPEVTIQCSDIWCRAWAKVHDALAAANWRPLDPEKVVTMDGLPAPWVDPNNIQAKVKYEDAIPARVRAQRPPWLWHKDKLPVPVASTKAWDVAERQDPSAEVFATVVGSREQLHLAGVWALSYKEHHRQDGKLPTCIKPSFYAYFCRQLRRGASTHDIILLVSGTIPQEAWKPYKALFSAVLPVPLFPAAGDKQIRDPRLVAIAQLWNRIEYKRIVFVDEYSMFWDNCNALMDFEPFAATPALFPGDRFSARVMVLRPDRSVYQDMLAKLRSPHYPRNSAADFLNAYFSNWYTSEATHRVPLSFSMDVTRQPSELLVPLKVLSFHPKAGPWASTSAASGGAGATQAWREYFCELDPALRPAALAQRLCADKGTILGAAVAVANAAATAAKTTIAKTTEATSALIGGKGGGGERAENMTEFRLALQRAHEESGADAEAEDGEGGAGVAEVTHSAAAAGLAGEALDAASVTGAAVGDGRKRTAGGSKVRAKRRLS
eukprot:SM000043S15785  [mRNA]  locus=s43:81691:89831:+ [translate_table: standard]